MEIDFNKNGSYKVCCTDGAAGLRSLPDKSVKLIYGSPPYPMQNETMVFGVLTNISKKWPPLLMQQGISLPMMAF